MRRRIIHDFTKLAVWNRAQAFAGDIFRLTSADPWRDALGMRNQIRGASQSIGANLAEGARSGSTPQFARFIDIAIASASETQNHLAFARRVNLLDPPRVDALEQENAEILRMLIGLQRFLLKGNTEY